jgi:DNA-binding transcriptional LysR family regulator
LAHARNVLRASEALIEATDDPSLIAGTLRLGVTEMIVHTWLREFLKQLKRPYPNLNVELTVDLSVSLEKSLATGMIDLALQNAPFTTETTGNVALGQYPSIWVASKDLNLHHGAALSAEELVAHPLLTHARNTRSFVEISGHFTGKTAHPARLVPSSNLAACAHMAVEGMGVAALPAAMVARELAQGDLVAVPYPWHPQDLEFYARFDAHRAPTFVTEAAQLAARVSKTTG